MPDDTDSLPDTDHGEIVSGEAPDDQTGEWLTIPEAVARTGRTERTIRRDVAARTYEVRQVKGRLQLWFPAKSGGEPDTAPTGLAMVAHLNQLSLQHLTTIERLAAENGELRETVGRLKAQLEAAAPKPDTVRLPWWKQWFGL